jgi:hypothetical protein
VATTLYSLAAIDQARGQLSSAWALYIDSIELLLTLDEPYYSAVCLIGVSGALLLQGKTPLCIQTLSAADAALTAIDAKEELSQTDEAEFQRIYEAVHSDDAGWREAWAAGQTLSTEQILRQILREPRPLDNTISA